MATATLTQTLTLLTSMDADTDALASPTSPTRIVRFDSECVLIPDLPTAPAKFPLVLTRSYSLPLWKKAAAKNPSPVAPIDEEGGKQESRARSPSPEDSRVILKVPIPLFRRRSSRSPSRHPRSLSTSPVISKTLPSCLVHRPPPTGLPSSSSTSLSTSLPITPSASTPLPLSPVRRVSSPAQSHSHAHLHLHSPLTLSPGKRRDDPPPPLLTVPLRACCAACEAATDTALAEGDGWKAHFTRGARRRRSASLESAQSFASSSSPPHAPSALHRAFSPPPPPPSAAVDNDHAHSGLRMTRGGAAAATAFALRVDEVDQRRRPFAFSNEEGHYAALRAAASTSGASSSSTSGASTSGPSNAAQKQPLYQAARRASAPRASSSSSANSNSPSTSGAGGAASSPPSSYLSSSYLSSSSSSPASYGSGPPYASPGAYPDALLLAVPDAHRLRAASPIAEEGSEDGSFGSRRSSVSVSSITASSIIGSPSRGSTPLLITTMTGNGSRRTSRGAPYTPTDDDDEAQLFPLPRRSPSSSPSPRASPVPGVRRSPSLGGIRMCRSKAAARARPCAASPCPGRSREGRVAGAARAAEGCRRLRCGRRRRGGSRRGGGRGRGGDARRVALAPGLG
ncbi:hypothetical protein BJ912DRAFT_150575 [Pholiota molesta]|nr:hypothetical protein BJ912DRAFT_150575 [Pholiota molesta]